MSLKLKLPSRGDAAVILLRLAIGFAVDALARRAARWKTKSRESGGQ